MRLHSIKAALLANARALISIHNILSRSFSVLKRIYGGFCIYAVTCLLSWVYNVTLAECCVSVSVSISVETSYCKQLLYTPADVT